MAKDKIEDTILKNLKGFIKKGAASTSPGNIPTGHFDLDFAIHNGDLPGDTNLAELEGYDSSKELGIPLGKVVEFFGEEGGGKCLSKDTFILSEKGMLTAEELFNEYDFKLTNSIKENEVSCGIVNEYNNTEKASHFYCNGKKKTKHKTKTTNTYHCQNITTTMNT